MAIGSHTLPNRGQTNDWLTPPELLEALGPFDLDPCCPPAMPWATAARHFVHGEQNGLAEPWSGRVWLNPPYGPEASAWLWRLAGHGNGIALVFARTETRMFFEAVWPVADALLFLYGRLHFHRLDGQRTKINAGGPSVLIAYGKDNARRLRACGLAGAFVSNVTINVRKDANEQA